MTRFQDWLTNLPTTNWKLVVGAGAFLATWLASLALVVLESRALIRLTPGGLELMNSLFWLVAAFNGLSVAQYTAKRVTYNKGSDDEHA